MKSAIATGLTSLLIVGMLACVLQCTSIANAQDYSPAGIPGETGYAAAGSVMGDQQVRVMDINELAGLLNSKSCVLLDARPREQFNSAHIPGAISMPLNEIPAYADQLDRNQLIVTYCGNYHCPISTKAATELMSLGFTNVWDYKGGIKEWQEKGYATASGQ